LNDFPENQLTKFQAVYTVDVYNSHKQTNKSNTSPL